MPKENKFFLFDVDGTLTPPRQRMTPDFEGSFKSWAADKKVYLVTGSDLPKLREQISDEIINKCEGVFCSMGNELYVKGKLVYANNDAVPNECLMHLNGYNCSTSYPYQRGTKHFEIRTGMVNFSVLGRDVSLEDRNKYYEWDLKNKEREFIANEFNKYFNEIGYEAKIGGQISIDIQGVGRNKSQASKYIRENFKNSWMVFFGDKTFEGGNDFDIADDILKNKDGEVKQVNGHEECLVEILKY